jgi:hypothetical protein
VACVMADEKISVIYRVVIGACGVKYGQEIIIDVIIATKDHHS